MDRRKFFAFLPLAPMVAVGVAEAASTPPKPDISEGSPRDDETRISIQGTMRPKTNYQLTSDGRGTIGFFPMNQTDPNRSVAMAVGEDGQLWIQSKGNKWKRVVTE